MAAAVRNVASANAAVAASVTVPVPTGTVDGDQLVVFIHANGSATFTKAGWTSIGSAAAVGGSGGSWAALTRTAASEPANYNFPANAGTPSMVGIMAALSASLAPTAATASLGSAGTYTAPSVTLSTSGLLLVAMGWTSTGTVTTPTGMTLQVNDTSGNNREALFSEIRASGATGTRSSSMSPAGAGYAISVGVLDGIVLTPYVPAMML